MIPPVSSTIPFDLHRAAVWNAQEDGAALLCWWSAGGLLLLQIPRGPKAFQKRPHRLFFKIEQRLVSDA